MTAEVLLALALVWIVAVSVIALVLIWRLHVAERRRRILLIFDPTAFRGVEPGERRFRRPSFGTLPRD